MSLFQVIFLQALMPGVLVVEAIVQTACYAVAIKAKDEMKNSCFFHDYR